MTTVQECFFCHHSVQPVHVHGHYQCPVCNTNMLPCCDGDNCETNQLLRTDASADTEENSTPGQLS